MSTHLIFEGAELSGKSFLMSQVYPILEREGSTSESFLDGCFWINSDVGVLGGNYGEAMVQKYVEMAEILKEKSVMFEKLHLSDVVYKTQTGTTVPDYKVIEERLGQMGFKVVLTTFEESDEVIKARLTDRLELYPHYKKIAKGPEFYIEQQRMYKEIVGKSTLPYMEVSLREFKDSEIQPVLDWIFK